MSEYLVNAIVFVGFFAVVILATMDDKRRRQSVETKQNTKVIFERLLFELYTLEEVVAYSRKIVCDELLHMALERMTCKGLKTTLLEACSKNDVDLVSAIFRSIDLSSDVLRLDQCVHGLYKDNLLTRDGCAYNAKLSTVVRTSLLKYLLCYEAEEGRLTTACLPDILSSSNPCETFYLLLSISKYYSDTEQYNLLKELASSENCIPKYSKEAVLFVTSLNVKSVNQATEWWKVFVKVGEDFVR